MGITISKIKFEIHGDDRGQLIALEENNNIPFDIKRIYYIYGTSDAIRRGCHAHRKLEQVIICIHGSCKLYLESSRERLTVDLDKPDEGIYVGNGVWRELFDFSDDAILLVLASELYDESDYIRDYETFRNEII